MKKEREIFIKLAILCAGYGIFSDAIVVPLVSTIFAEFPNSGTFLMNFIISGPALIAIPTALIAGKLARYISKKYLLIAGFVLYLIGGLGGIVANNIEFLVVTRVFSGAATGVIGTIAMAFIPELYSDLKERSKVIGWYNAASALFGVGMAFIAGIIGVISWRNAFFVNAFSLVSLLLIIFFLPKTAPEGKLEKEETISRKKHYPIIKVIILMVAFFVFSVLWCVIYYCIDLFVAEKALGTSALSGSLTALGTLASFLCALIFGNFYNKIKRMMPFIFFLACGISFAVLSISSNVIAITIACIVAGGANAISVSYYGMVLSEIVPESQMSLSMSFYFIVANIAVFFSPYIPLIIQNIFSVTTYYESFLYIGIFLVIGAIISLCIALCQQKKLSADK